LVVVEGNELRTADDNGGVRRGVVFSLLKIFRLAVGFCVLGKSTDVFDSVGWIRDDTTLRSNGLRSQGEVTSNLRAYQHRYFLRSRLAP
jgi:hypothetical protein